MVKKNDSKMNEQPIVIIKCGGSILKHGSELHSLINGINTLKNQGFVIVIVHGGGPDINQLCEALNIKSQFVKGLRITDKDVLNVTQMALLGKTNNNLVHKLNIAKIRSIGLSGHDDNLLKAKFIDQVRLGHVGEIVDVNTKLLFDLLNLGLTPVIAPLGVDDEGNAYNVNGDVVAGAIAAAIACDQLVLLSDVPGFYQDFNDKSSLVAKITSSKITTLLQKKQISGGMIPKLAACLDAVNAGVKSAHIVSGKEDNWLNVVTDRQSNIGTTVIKG